MTHDQRLSLCISKLRMLRGLPPYDDGGNICRGDGYFGNSIENDFPADLYQEADKLVMAEKAEWEKTRKAHIARFASDPAGVEWRFTDQEEFDAIMAMKSNGGSFASALAAAWLAADLSNRAILRKGWVGLAEYYHKYHVAKEPK